jgi:hypothetical protein
MHNASVHGMAMVRKDGTIATPRNRQVDFNRQQNQEQRLTASNAAYELAPPLWVTRESQRSIRQDASLRSRVQLLAGREIYLVNRKPFTLGNGTGGTLNVSTVASWTANQLNSTTETTIPYAMWEFIGLEVTVHGHVAPHGDFALVYYTVPNGGQRIGGSNVTSNTVTSSPMRDAMLALRWSNALTRHTVITGPGSFFIPADGPGSRIDGAGYLNIISGTSVLQANAVLATVTMSAVYGVVGDRQ